MKKAINILLVISVLFSLLVFDVNAAENSAELVLTKSQCEYTDMPIEIKAKYSNVKKEYWQKKSYLRVDLADNSENLLSVYRQNKDKEVILTGQELHIGNSYNTTISKDVTLNGTYIFCGWSSDNEEPDYISSVDVTEIETERPMAELEFSLTGDFSQDVVATAKIRNMESGKDTSIKRYALVKGYALPPGSWPTSLAPEYCNEVYDERIAELYDEFVNSRLFLGDISTDSGSEVTSIDNVYRLRDIGDYILFMEDSKGKYNALNFYIPSLSAENNTPPDIEYSIVGSDNNGTQVKVTAKDDDGIAKLNYVVLKKHDIASSSNGTQEYFLENERIPIESETITIKSSIIICATDIFGNASYKRVELSDTDDSGNVEPTPGPKVITVEPPTASVESGKVAYGTEVILTPSTGHLAYSVNGGNFVYKYFSDTIIITKDTTITVKSWMDALEPNTEYDIKEAVYTYTVDEDTISNPYVIEQMSLLSVTGEQLTDIPDDSSFIVEITLNEVKNREEKDYIFVAVYGTEGQLLNLNYVKTNFKVNEEYSFGFNIQAAKEPIGSIKAYVWGGFNSMEPLAESKIINKSTDNN